MHRDIKPENLIFTHDWQLKVTDFGIAQVLSGDSTMGTEEGAIVGTPAYMSPEQAEGRSCGPPADVYASGAMLYEMLTGSLPFPSAESAMDMAMARLNEEPVPIDAVGPVVPDAIAEATMHALTRRDSDRFQSAEEFGVALAEAAAFTWGPEWMTESGTAVQGSAAIVDAARTTDRRRFSGADLERVLDDATPDGPADDTAEDCDATSTIVAEVADAPSTEAPAAPTETPPPVEPPVFEAAPTAPVLPQQRERVAGADLNQLKPDDIMNLREVRGPGTLPSCWQPCCVLALLAAGGGRCSDAASAAIPTAVAMRTRMRIDGTTVVARSEQPIEVDLTEPFSLDVPAGVESVSATFFGIPIGSADVEDGQLDPGYLQYTGAGVIELRADGTEGADAITVPVRASNSPYPTAPFVAAAMLGLGGFASVQANLRGLRAPSLPPVAVSRVGGQRRHRGRCGRGSCDLGGGNSRIAQLDHRDRGPRRSRLRSARRGLPQVVPTSPSQACRRGAHPPLTCPA